MEERVGDIDDMFRCPCCNVGSQEAAGADAKWEVKCESAVEKPTRWQIVWHPTLEVTEADGTEVGSERIFYVKAVF